MATHVTPFRLLAILVWSASVDVSLIERDAGL